MTFKTVLHSLAATAKRQVALMAGAATLVGLSLGATPSPAQGLYSPIVTVNDSAVTRYERQQRMAFLRILQAPGDISQVAMDQLINEKLQMAEAKRLGVAISDEAIAEGMAEFASRGNLSVEQFLAMIAQAGVAPETFRDFVRSGLTWREVAGSRFAPTVTVTQAEIDRAYAEAEPTPGVKLLLTEIILPASSAASLKASRARADRLSKITDSDEFSSAASRFSVVATRLNKGQRDWLDIQALPAPAQAALRNVPEGRASRPIVLEGVGVAVYFVRDRETIRTNKVGTLLDYAAFTLPKNVDAAKLDADVQTCDELYPIARGLPAEQLVREELPVGAVPARYRAELANLDPGEATTLAAANGATVYLMLCNRRNDVPDSVSPAQIAEAIRNQRIGALANDYLAELRAQAHIDYVQ